MEPTKNYGESKKRVLGKTYIKKDNFLFKHFFLVFAPGRGGWRVGKKRPERRSHTPVIYFYLGPKKNKKRPEIFWKKNFNWIIAHLFFIRFLKSLLSYRIQPPKKTPAVKRHISPKRGTPTPPKKNPLFYFLKHPKGHTPGGGFLIKKKWKKKRGPPPPPFFNFCL